MPGTLARSESGHLIVVAILVVFAATLFVVFAFDFFVVFAVAFFVGFFAGFFVIGSLLSVQYLKHGSSSRYTLEHDTRQG